MIHRSEFRRSEFQDGCSEPQTVPQTVARLLQPILREWTQSPMKSDDKHADGAAARRTGVWIVGARGGVATTAILGSLALKRGLSPAQGMVSELAECQSLSLPPVDGFVFGGHDIRAKSLADGAREIDQDTGTFGALTDQLSDDLAEVEPNLRPGVLLGGGEAIDALADPGQACIVSSASEALQQLRSDLAAFRQDNELVHIVVVNLASTEPPASQASTGWSLDELRDAIAADDRENLQASTLYALAAAEEGCGFVNFTPSPGALLPALTRYFESQGLPFTGSDGKTGETLIKSSLAPLFAKRNLRVLSWQGYNMLGDRDGQVLSNESNRQTKVESKDHLLVEALGYPVHSKVSIDYVPSLNDWKTAWDFIHFQGFLGVKMSLQFTWQGCDAILAAPLVLDLIRFTALALERGESGPLSHLAAFFKSPHGITNPDFHYQHELLRTYVSARTTTP